MPHLNICNLTASVLRIVLVATKNTGLLSLNRMNLLLSLWSKTGKENFVTSVLVSSLPAQVLPDPAMKAVAVALSVAESELAQGKSHLSLAAIGNVRDLLHLVSPAVQDCGLSSPAWCQGRHHGRCELLPASRNPLVWLCYSCVLVGESSSLQQIHSFVHVKCLPVRWQTCKAGVKLELPQL